MKPLKIKHILRVHSYLPNYPDSDDILFDLKNYFLDSGTDLAIGEEFTDTVLKNLYGHEKMESVMSKMLFLEKTGFFTISQTPKKRVFTLLREL